MVVIQWYKWNSKPCWDDSVLPPAKGEHRRYLTMLFDPDKITTNNQKGLGKILTNYLVFCPLAFCPHTVEHCFFCKKFVPALHISPHQWLAPPRHMQPGLRSWCKLITSENQRLERKIYHWLHRVHPFVGLVGGSISTYRVSQKKVSFKIHL